MTSSIASRPKISESPKVKTGAVGSIRNIANKGPYMNRIDLGNFASAEHGRQYEEKSARAAPHHMRTKSSYLEQQNRDSSHLRMRVSSLKEDPVDSLRRENEDLKTNLRLNKESLQAMLIESQNKTAKETSLIETINIISQENGTLKEQIEALKGEQLNKIDKVSDSHKPTQTIILFSASST